MSEWQMPQAATAMRTWPLPASGMGFSTSLEGIPGLVISTALIVLAMRSYLLWASDAGDARKERGRRSGVVHFARGAQPRIEAPCIQPGHGEACSPAPASWTIVLSLGWIASVQGSQLGRPRAARIIG